MPRARHAAQRSARRCASLCATDRGPRQLPKVVPPGHPNPGPRWVRRSLARVRRWLNGRTTAERRPCSQDPDCQPGRHCPPGGSRLPMRWASRLRGGTPKPTPGPLTWRRLMKRWPLPGFRAVDTYLNSRRDLDCVAASGADAVHPGYGFLAENAAFAEAVAAAGAVFIGPSPRWLEAWATSFVPARCWPSTAFRCCPARRRWISRGGPRRREPESAIPLMLKPAAGGGGIGMQVVHDDHQLTRHTGVPGASPGIVRRRYGVSRGLGGAPRHVEIQLLATAAAVRLHALRARLLAAASAPQDHRRGSGPGP
jgi:hypothetical protein